MRSPERANTVRHWIQSAGDRLKRAETYDPGDDTTLNCEDAQQAAELALKGLIAIHGHEPKRTHDLVTCCVRSSNWGKKFPTPSDDARI